MSEYRKLAEELVGGMLGLGRQHNPFLYSRPDLTPSEKAKERARHYRRVKQEAAGKMEANPEAHKQHAYFHKETGERVPAYSKEGQTRPVKLDEEEKAREAARGLKPKKETLPKKGSERKPYVGSKMKAALLNASPYEEDSKEGKNLLNRAKRMYKEGGISWEEVMSQLLAA